MLSPFGSEEEGVTHPCMLLVLAISARGIAKTEFDQDPSLMGMTIVVRRGRGGDLLPVDLTFFDADGRELEGVGL